MKRIIVNSRARGNLLQKTKEIMCFQKNTVVSSFVQYFFSGIENCQPVNRHSSQCEAAGIHGEVDDQVDHFAHEGAKHPSLQGVDCGLERNADDDEEEISHTQVEYEQIGCVVSDLSAPQQHGEHQAVANSAEQEDKGKDH